MNLAKYLKSQLTEKNHQHAAIKVIRAVEVLA